MLPCIPRFLLRCEVQVGKLSAVGRPVRHTSRQSQPMASFCERCLYFDPSLHTRVTSEHTQPQHAGQKAEAIPLIPLPLHLGEIQVAAHRKPPLYVTSYIRRWGSKIEDKMPAAATVGLWLCSIQNDEQSLTVFSSLPMFVTCALADK
jgi:hypothetical protein